MKITKAQLKETVRRIVRESLKEQSLIDYIDVDHLDDEKFDAYEDEEFGTYAFDADTERARDRSYEDEAGEWLKKLGIQEQSYSYDGWSDEEEEYVMADEYADLTDPYATEFESEADEPGFDPGPNFEDDDWEE